MCQAPHRAEPPLAQEDVRLINRLILTPEAESNLFSRANLSRGIASGIANIEFQTRLRYEISRKFAPYAGFDWDREVGAVSARRNGPLGSRSATEDSSSVYECGGEIGLVRRERRKGEL